MNNQERDAYLIETIGECWHSYRIVGVNGDNHIYKCTRCPQMRLTSYSKMPKQDYNFSTWEGFGKLWEWVDKQEWWADFRRSIAIGFDSNLELHIHPDRFANAIYEYLKSKE